MEKNQSCINEINSLSYNLIETCNQSINEMFWETEFFGCMAGQTIQLPFPCLQTVCQLVNRLHHGIRIRFMSLNEKKNTPFSPNFWCFIFFGLLLQPRRFFPRFLTVFVEKINIFLAFLKLILRLKIFRLFGFVQDSY